MDYLFQLKIFNFNQFVNTLDLDAFLSNPEILPCNSDGSSYGDKHYKHILAGDLRIIKNNVLRKLFTKRTQFKEDKPINFDKAKSCILTALEEYIQNWCNKNGVNKFFFLSRPITSLLK